MSELLEKLVDELTAATLESSNATRDLIKHTNELETALNRMVLAHENSMDDSDGEWPAKDSGCPDCTRGTVPDRRNTGPCAYHNAKRLLGQL